MIHENILYGYDYDDENNTLVGRLDIKDYGFFSTFTLMLTSIMIVYKKFNTVPKDIDGRNLLNKLKKEQDVDMYKYFFNIDKSVDISFDEELPVPFSPDDHHTIYYDSYSKYYTPFFKRFFNLNKNVLDKIKELEVKYNISYNNSVSVIFRDSDKWTDMGGFNYISAAGYLRKCREILDNNEKRLNVIIQSENNGVVKTFNEAFSSVYFEETSLGNPSDIYPPIPINVEKRLSWAEYYIAALWIISKCEHVITYTGNSSFFIYLNRGTTKNLTQEITFTKNYNDFFVSNN